MYKRIISVLMAVGLLLTIIGASACSLPQPPVGEEPFPRVTVLAPDWSGFVPDADKWNFGTMLLTPSTEVLEARFVGAQIEDQFVTSLDEVGWTEVARVGRQVEGLLDEYEDLRQSMVERHAQPGGLAAHIVEGKYQVVRWRIYGILREQAEEIGGILVIIPPMQVDLGETAIVELIFEVRRKNDPTRTYRVVAPTPVSKISIDPVVEEIPYRSYFKNFQYTYLVGKQEPWPQIIVIASTSIEVQIPPLRPIRVLYLRTDGHFIVPVSPPLEARFLGTRIGDLFIANPDDQWIGGRVTDRDGLDLFVLYEMPEQEMQKIRKELEELGEMWQIRIFSRYEGELPSGTISPAEALDVELVFEVRKRDDPDETLRFTVPTRLTRAG